VTLRVLSLFAGIGGFDLGLERTGGFKTVAFCEVLPFCRRVVKHQFPGVRIYDDVRELTGEILAADGIAVDVIVGGFPCQDISLAGEGLGLEGERSGLWWEYHRLIGETDPAIVIVENVAELLGRGFGDVLGSLAALGFDAWWDCIPAFAVGADHERDRVWAVATHDHQARLSRGMQARADSPDARDIAARIGLALADPPQVPREHGPLRPLMGGRSHGVSNRLDRIAALGNAVVPQIPELIGRAILASLEEQRRAA
jgi:DNA (cytosine-5)-methyltransferase 1